MKPNYHNTLNEKIPPSSLFLKADALTFSLHQNLEASAGIKCNVQKRGVIGKVVDRYSNMVVDVATFGTNGWRRCCCGRQWWRERGSCICAMGGELDDGGAGKVTYVGGWTKYIVLKEGVGMEEVQRMVSEITGNDLIVQKLWHSLKYDRRMVMKLEDGNNKHGYLYVGDSDGPKRRAQKATRSCNHGVVCGRSGRCKDDMVQILHFMSTFSALKIQSWFVE
ncbi:hypothetical protein Cgig2_005943 [Carnegiea gigantea]|uniref:Uncharacterized protein n=1 Tax=Carnegiea gigantea TaxID=171969 RepID=A0A9Q1QK12_9CARY|nr:hypothetical protein Cgig2_005943 [Carnegiea gigantea]